jgi:hypothetical protein
MGAAACAAKPSARMRAPAFEGGSVTIRGIWYKMAGAGIYRDGALIGSVPGSSAISFSRSFSARQAR